MFNEPEDSCDSDPQLDCLLRSVDEMSRAINGDRARALRAVPPSSVAAEVDRGAVAWAGREKVRGSGSPHPHYVV
jgi:hypothetical protein